jgi:predicted metal-dependent HD superfamily phosphohydrolase
MLANIRRQDRLFQSALREAEERYDANGLAYHNRARVVFMLNTFRKWNPPLSHKARAIVELATVFHDVVCVPGSTNNKSESADFAKAALSTLELSDWMVERVSQAILSTATHAPPRPDLIQALVVDLDLCDLGTDNYVSNVALIRSEFGHVSDETFRIGRIDFLENYLAKIPLFNTAYGSQYETQARRHMLQELSALQRGESTWIGK